MAMVNDTFYVLTATMMDRDKNKRDFSINLPDDLLLADLVTAVSGGFQTLIAGISDAVLVGWSLSIGGQDTAPAQAPEGSDVERKGSFGFLADNGQSTKVEVPSIKNTLVVDGTNKILESDAAVAAFIAYMTSGIVGLAAPVTNTGAGLASVTRAVKIHRGSSKG